MNLKASHSRKKHVIPKIIERKAQKIDAILLRIVLWLDKTYDWVAFCYKKCSQNNSPCSFGAFSSWQIHAKAPDLNARKRSEHEREACPFVHPPEIVRKTLLLARATAHFTKKHEDLARGVVGRFFLQHLCRDIDTFLGILLWLEPQHDFAQKHIQNHSQIAQNQPKSHRINQKQ